ncbi:hypothetical protein E2C01_021801 [Portunus trituberculatus]|uniref:Uncharacterized protein n=1 Tax=Portunus trituberculatus TaxID=210409 RepID=A0A5B7E5Q4_PORTR|nr:hypothetical protein [Portunus trituberculatus]
MLCKNMPNCLKMLYNTCQNCFKMPSKHAKLF